MSERPAGPGGGGAGPVRPRGRFATTRWSVVLAAGTDTSTRSSEALAHLCETYWHPVYAFIRRQGYDADAGADLTQAFFALVLEKNYFHAADPARGRFRSFLCTAVRHFLSNERDRVHTLKRGGQHAHMSLDIETAEGRYQLDPRDDLTPEKLFDRQWALTLLDRVLARLADEFTRSGKADLFAELKGSLTGDGTTRPYAEIGQTLGMSEGSVKVAAHRLRRQFRDILIDEIAQTVSEPADVDAEIAYLLNAVRL
jgi:RNA polymerase sigma-70 factor (ECF subfamily)